MLSFWQADEMIEGLFFFYPAFCLRGGIMEFPLAFDLSKKYQSQVCIYRTFPLNAVLVNRYIGNPYPLSMFRQAFNPRLASKHWLHPYGSLILPCFFLSSKQAPDHWHPWKLSIFSFCFIPLTLCLFIKYSQANRRLKCTEHFFMDSMKKKVFSK